MIKGYRLYQIDSFTNEKFKGNPAGVITNADGLIESQMQKIARELNNSETAFVFSPDNKDYDVCVRYFTPTKEVPICGHATIAAHYARAIENNMDTSRIYQKSGAGILPVDIIRSGNNYRIVMTQGKIEFGALIEGEERKALLKALGVAEKDLNGECPVQIVSTGHSKVMVGIKSKTLLDRLLPDLKELIELSGRIGCNGYYVFTFDTGDKDILVCGRMFAPAIGISEDPVTGNANGPLGAYLVHHGLVEHDGSGFVFNARQGEAIGRTGAVEVEVNIADMQPVKVKISGEAVIVFKTELTMENE